MPSDKHNSEMAMATATATGLISSLFNVILSQNVLFRETKMLQCIHHGAIFVGLTCSNCNDCKSVSHAILCLKGSVNC